MSAHAPEWPEDRGGHVWPKDRQTSSADGTLIRYTVRGRPDGPWVALAAGYLCPDNFWSTIGPMLMERYRVVVLNYRSVGASADPRPPGYRAIRLRPDDYRIPRFAEDVRAVLEAEDATDVTLVGHSMGCQVALETWRQDRDRIAALALVTGPYASPLQTFYGSKLGAYLFPVAEVAIPLLPRPLQRRIPEAMRLPIAMPLGRLVRALGPRTPKAGMQDYFQHFSRIDPMIALKIARGMHDFDAGPWLPEIDVPTLVVVGERDTFSPPALGQHMVERIPDSELVTIREGTHAALIEFPAEIHDALADFLHRRLGHPAAARRGQPGVAVPGRG